jgi:hypothetical protein
MMNSVIEHAINLMSDLSGCSAWYLFQYFSEQER